jgi:thiol-disulfide isomerase/thioredoxin
MLDNGLSPASLYQMHPERYRYLIDSLFVINKLFFNEFVGKTELPDNFKQTELASLKYDRATKLIEYLYSSTYAHEVQEKQYLEFLEKLSVNTPELLSIYEYKSFLRAYITYFSNKKINAKNLASHEITLSKIQTVNLLIENQEIKDYLLFTFLKDQVKYYGYKDSEILFEVFKLNCKNEDFKLQLLAPYNAFINLSEKQQAPAFNISRSNGETLTISHFEDSYIYIDVWASWCLPCGKETPFFEKLKQKYKDKQIEFVSLSIDSKKEDWMEYLESKKLDHNQFLVLDTELFLDAYMIKTIPHFLIIDDKGNLIDNNASRPSEERTEWLDKLPNKHSVGSRLR